MPCKRNSNFAHSYFTVTSNSNPPSWTALGEVGSNVQGTQGTQRSTRSPHRAGTGLREQRSDLLWSTGAPIFYNSHFLQFPFSAIPLRPVAAWTFSHFLTPAFRSRLCLPSAYVSNTRNGSHIANPKGPIIEINYWKVINACRKQTKSVTVILKSKALHIQLCKL